MKFYSTLILILLFISSLTYAKDDQIVTDVGLGSFGSKGSSLSQDKFTKIGIEEELWSPFHQRLNVGGWLDSRGTDFNNSAFVGYQLGFEVTNSVLEGSVWTGPTLISSPDAALGSNFQFNETIFFGIVDKDKNSIGMAYNHFSDAGLAIPNLGRDFLGLEIKCSF